MKKLFLLVMLCLALLVSAAFAEEIKDYQTFTKDEALKMLEDEEKDK